MYVAKYLVLAGLLATIHAQDSTKGSVRGPTGKEYEVVYQQLDFSQAKARCAQLGGALPTAKSAQDVDFLATAAGGGNKMIMVGAQPEMVNGKCVARWLSDGSLVQNVIWNEAEPYCDGPCRVVRFDATFKQWFTFPCHVPAIPVFCEKSAPAEDLTQSLSDRQSALELKINSLSDKLAKVMNDLSAKVKEHEKKIEYLYG